LQARTTLFQLLSPAALPLLEVRHVEAPVVFWPGLMHMSSEWMSWWQTRLPTFVGDQITVGLKLERRSTGEIIAPQSHDRLHRASK
jgi:hypothetical protein